MCVFIHTTGVAVMMSSDAQKFNTLQNKSGLITEGLFSRTRNPNYLGEMMIYGTYALMAGHWLAWAILAWVWIGYFTINMIIKDRSLATKPGWNQYKQSSNILLPKIFKEGLGKSIQ